MSACKQTSQPATGLCNLWMLQSPSRKSISEVNPLFVFSAYCKRTDWVHFITVYLCWLFSSSTEVLRSLSWFFSSSSVGGVSGECRSSGEGVRPEEEDGEAGRWLELGGDRTEGLAGSCALLSGTWRQIKTEAEWFLTLIIYCFSHNKWTNEMGWGVVQSWWELLFSVRCQQIWRWTLAPPSLCPSPSCPPLLSPDRYWTGKTAQDTQR